MKARRQALIREIVDTQSIQTQEELAQALREHGMVVTQATVSRDIKEMHLLKVLAEDGSYRYATMDKEEQGTSDRLIRMLADSVVGMDSANIRNMLRIFGGDPAEKVHKLMDYTARGGDVADPWYSERFDVAYRDIFDGCTALLDAILKQDKQ